MIHTHTRSKSGTAASVPFVSVLVAALISVAAAAPHSAVAMPADLQATDESTQATAPSTEAPSTEAAAEDAGQAEAARLAEQWGIEIASIRLTANNHMIDYRYRVLDAAKATDLFTRQIKPALIHQETGKVLAVPETAKIGPLRNSNTPQAGKIYWMFFGNAGNLVKPGDKVTVVIGDFRTENLVVE